MERTHDLRHVDTDLMRYRLGWLTTIGLVLSATGLTAIYAAYYSDLSLQNLIGSFFLIGGAMFVPDAVWSRREGRFSSEFPVGLLYLMFAFLIFVYAAGEPRTLTLVLSIFFVLEGILKIFFALRLRPESDWTWELTSGIVSAIIGAAVWGIPAGTPLVCVMVGIDMSYSGLAIMMVAHAMRKKLEMREILCIGDVCFSE